MLDTTQPQCRVPEKSQGGLLLHLGFFAFVIWLLGYPKIAVLYSVSVYQALPLPHLLFAVAFAAFGLLASTRKLKPTGIPAALASLAAVAAGLVFVFLDAAIARLVSFSAIAVLAAYTLVAWGGILRDMTAEELFSLMAKTLLAVGGFTLICAVPYLASGYTNPHSHYLFVLLMLAVLPLCSGLHFLARRAGTRSHGGDSSEPPLSGCDPEPSPPDYGLAPSPPDYGSERPRPGCNPERPQPGWRHGGLLPFAIVLFATAALTMGVDGYSYRPTMINSVQLDIWQGLLELCLAALALLARGMSQGGLPTGWQLGRQRERRTAGQRERRTAGQPTEQQLEQLEQLPEQQPTELPTGLPAERLTGQQFVGFSSFVAAAFLAILLLTVFALLLAFLGLGSLTFTQALLGAMGDSFFLALLFFCGYSGSSDRAASGIGGAAKGGDSAGGTGDDDSDSNDDRSASDSVPGSSNRDGFFVRLLAAILCSGFYWSFALGTAIQQLVGYDISILAFASASGVIVISALAIVAVAIRPINRLGIHASLTASSEDDPEDGDSQPGRYILAGAGAGAGAGAVAQDSTVSQPTAALRAAFAASRTANAAEPIGDDELHALVKGSIIEWRRQALAPYQLSNREFQLACMLVEGFTAPAIADELGISVNTVKGYMKTMYRKCDVISKAEFIRLAAGDAKSV